MQTSTDKWTPPAAALTDSGVMRQWSQAALGVTDASTVAEIEARRDAELAGLDAEADDVVRETIQLAAEALTAQKRIQDIEPDVDTQEDGADDSNDGLRVVRDEPSWKHPDCRVHVVVTTPASDAWDVCDFGLASQFELKTLLASDSEVRHWLVQAMAQLGADVRAAVVFCRPARLRRYTPSNGEAHRVAVEKRHVFLVAGDFRRGAPYMVKDLGPRVDAEPPTTTDQDDLRSAYAAAHPSRVDGPVPLVYVTERPSVLVQKMGPPEGRDAKTATQRRRERRKKSKATVVSDAQHVYVYAGTEGKPLVSRDFGLAADNPDAGRLDDPALGSELADVLAGALRLRHVVQDAPGAQFADGDESNTTEAEPAADADVRLFRIVCTPDEFKAMEAAAKPPDPSGVTSTAAPAVDPFADPAVAALLDESPWPGDNHDPIAQLLVDFLRHHAIEGADLTPLPSVVYDTWYAAWKTGTPYVDNGRRLAAAIKTSLDRFFQESSRLHQRQVRLAATLLLERPPAEYDDVEAVVGQIVVSHHELVDRLLAPPQPPSQPLSLSLQIARLSQLWLNLRLWPELTEPMRAVVQPLGVGLVYQFLKLRHLLLRKTERPLQPHDDRQLRKRAEGAVALQDAQRTRLDLALIKAALK
jgi:hypothetical protein